MNRRLNNEPLTNFGFSMGRDIVTLRVGINGFGRIGRNVLRAFEETPRSDIEFVAVNDLADFETAAFLLEYDSVHGRLAAPVTYDGDVIRTAKCEVRYFSERDPSALPWGKLGVDVVFECTGIFTAAEKAGDDRDGAPLA